MNDNVATGMIIDGIASSELIDSSGEILDVAGCDISDFQSGTAILNYEHNPNDDPSKNIGVILGATKIFSEKDCENDRQLYFWNKVNENIPSHIPIIYLIARLFDGSGHEQAKAVAAQIRDHVKNNEKNVLRFSIEGTTLEKQGNRLVTSIARKCALTVKPCNKTCDSGVLLDPEGDRLKLANSLVEKTEAEPFITSSPLSPPMDVSLPSDPPLSKKENPLSSLFSTFIKGKILVELTKNLTKTLSVGNGNVAPSQLTQGAALAHSSFKKKKKIPFLKSSLILRKTEAAVVEMYQELMAKKIISLEQAG